METMLLHLQDIHTDGTRVVGGNIYFSIGDCFFPQENWYDMVSVNLETWLPDLISFAQNHTDCCVFFFMDCPSKVKLTRQADGTVIAACYWDQAEQVPETVVDFPILMESIRKCVRKYHRTLHENGIPFPFGNLLSKLDSIQKSMTS